MKRGSINKFLMYKTISSILCFSIILFNFFPIISSISNNIIKSSKNYISDDLGESYNKLNLKNITSPISVNNIVIFIRFNGESEFLTSEKSKNINNSYNDLIDNDNDGFSDDNNYSFKAYFNDLSRGLLDINTHFYPKSNDVTYLSYEDIYPRDYYYGTPAGDVKEVELIRRAFEAVKSEINLTAEQLDSLGENGSDGLIDNVTFVIKGYAESYGNILWSHKNTLSPGNNISLAGKELGSYNFIFQENDLTGVFSGSDYSMRIPVHEFLHILDFRDLYRYSGVGLPVGPWDIMGNTDGLPPIALMATQEFFLNYTDGVDEITQSGTYTLDFNSYNSKGKKTAYKIRSPYSSTEYFMVEYRNNKLNDEITQSGTYTLDFNSYNSKGKKTAYKIRSPYSSTEYFMVEYRNNKLNKWDKTLPGSGLIVYRINTAAPNNHAGPPDRLYVFRPGETSPTASSGNTKLAYFSLESNRTSIGTSKLVDSFDNNNLFFQDGLNSGIVISNIGSAEGDSITFDVELPDVQGSGTVEDPFKIYTADDLLNINYGLNKHYKLMNDIDLSSVSNWTTIGGRSSKYFTGTFNGNDYTIYNMNSIGNSYENAGLFYGIGKTARVYDLILKDADVNTTVETGILSRYILGEVDNISILDSVIRTSSDVSIGGIASYIGETGSLFNSSINVDITSTANKVDMAGGIAGELYKAEVSNNFFKGTINANVEYKGGLFGKFVLPNKNSSNNYWDVNTTNINVGAGIYNSTSPYPELIGIKVSPKLDIDGYYKTDSIVEYIPSDYNNISPTFTSDNILIAYTSSEGEVCSFSNGTTYINTTFVIGLNSFTFKTKVNVTGISKQIVNINDNNLKIGLNKEIEYETGITRIPLQDITVSELYLLGEKSKEIDLSNLNISDITGIEYLINARSIDLSNNSISNISSISLLSNLSVVNLNNNNISDISPIAKLSNLEKIYIDNNRIKDISSIAQNIVISANGQVINEQINVTATNDYILPYPIKDRAYSNPITNIININNKTYTTNNKNDITIDAQDLINDTQLSIEFKNILNRNTKSTFSGRYIVNISVINSPVDKNDLYNLIKSVMDLIQDEYTTESWDNLQRELDNANKILSDHLATQDQVDRAKDSLESAINNLVLKPIDKSRLKMLLDYSSTLISSDYTIVSWKNLLKVKNDANIIMVNNQATQIEVNAVTYAFENVITNLVSIKDLSELVNIVESLNKEDYTDSSWNALISEKIKSKIILDKPNATQDEVDRAFLGLTNFLLNLKINKIELEELIKSASSLIPSDYTNDSYSDLDKEIYNANIILKSDTATSNQVKQAVVRLKIAINSLVIIEADKTILNQIIDYIDGLFIIDYTIDSWNNLQNNLNIAKGAIANPNIKQSEIDLIVNDISLAIDLLVIIKADLIEIQLLINNINSLDKDSYTLESWESLSLVLDKANDVILDNYVKQSEVNRLVVLLKEKVDNLVKILVDKTKLESLINYISMIPKDNYTNDSYNNLIIELEKSKFILSNDSASQSQVDNIVISLLELLKSLIKVIAIEPEIIFSQNNSSIPLEIYINYGEEIDFINSDLIGLKVIDKFDGRVVSNSLVNVKFEEIDTLNLKSRHNLSKFKRYKVIYSLTDKYGDICSNYLYLNVNYNLDNVGFTPDNVGSPSTGDRSYILLVSSCLFLSGILLYKFRMRKNK